jgi:uncharacterized protein YrrD
VRKGRDIIGLPVMDIHTGKRIGTVVDIMFAADFRANCVLLETRTWFTAPRSVEWDKIVSFGEDAVTVPEESFVKECQDENNVFFLLDGKGKLKGLPVMTKNGQELGFVEDVYFSNKMDKRIVGFELSDGFLSDVTEGRNWLPCPESAVKGEDALIVPVHCNQEVRPLTNMENG